MLDIGSTTATSAGVLLSASTPATATTPTTVTTSPIGTPRQLSHSVDSTTSHPCLVHSVSVPTLKTSYSESKFASFFASHSSSDIISTVSSTPASGSSPSSSEPSLATTPMAIESSIINLHLTPLNNSAPTPTTPTRPVRSPSISDTPTRRYSEGSQLPLSSPSKTTAPTQQQPFSPSSVVPKTPAKTPSKSPQVGGARPISPLDEQRLIQRQKQIDYGYRTVGYLRYRLLVPKDKRKPEHPRTPKKAQGCSKRSWDGQLKKWRRDLHLWDPDNMDAFKSLLNSEFVDTIINGNHELLEIARVVREKLNNPQQPQQQQTNAKGGEEEGEESEEEEGEVRDDSSLIDNNSVTTTTTSTTTTTPITTKTSAPESRLDKVARTLVF